MKTAVMALVAGMTVAVALGAQEPQTPPAGRGAAGRQNYPPPSRGGGGGGGAAGPADKPLVDFALADKGKDVWIAECVTCHGAQARGTDNGPNLMRSLIFLRDRYGSEIGPFLKKGHPLQSGKPASSLTDEQITNISHFLRKQLNDTLRGAAGVHRAGHSEPAMPRPARSSSTAPANAPRAIPRPAISPAWPASTKPSTSNSACCSPAADAEDDEAGRRRGAPCRSTVTPQGSAAGIRRARLHGRLRRHAPGPERRVASFRRSAALKVQKTDPLEAHHALLETLTDKNIHDLVAYLETLK